MVEERWVDVDEVAGHLQVTKDSVYRWTESKGFPAHRVGRLFRFKLSEVDKWVKKQQPNRSRSNSGDK
jgi:excisionase family DNA binding protein